MRERFDINRLDPDNPFEIDGENLPHLYKHLPNREGRFIAVGIEDLLDVYLYGEVLYYEGKEDGEADWIMVGVVPGLVLKVALAPPKSGDPRMCRPIGLRAATPAEEVTYRRDSRGSS